MRIKIPTDKKRYFGQVLEILSSVPPFSSLTRREKTIYAALLFENFENRKLPYNERRDIVFSPDTFEKIRFDLGVSKATIHVTMSSLRKKGICTYDYFCKGFDIMPSTEIIYKFVEVSQ